MSLNTDDMINKVTKEILDDGNANIIVIGKTGVGKSTLINNVFRGNVAETGTGKPVTKGIHKISKDGIPLTIIDTQGLEVKDYDNINNEIQSYVKKSMSSEKAEDHIHIAWLCISYPGARVEEAEKDLAKFFHDNNIPIIVILTKTTNFKKSDNEFFSAVRKEFDEHCSNIVMTRGVQETIDEDEDEEPIILKIKGIDELITKTEQLIPEQKKRAFANALSIKNKNGLQAKKDRAEIEINTAAGLAGTAAAVPIPLSDAVSLIPIQIGMLIKVSYTFGMDVKKSAITGLVVSIFGSSLATFVGKSIVRGLLKLIPGGQIAGSVISATTAAALTKTLGEAYLSILISLAEESDTSEIDFSKAASMLKNKVKLSF